LAGLALWGLDRWFGVPAAAATTPASPADPAPAQRADGSSAPVRHDDPFLDTFLKRLDPDIAASFTDEQLNAIRLSFGAQVRQRHPLDIRRSVLVLCRRYYLILLAGRERRPLERLYREGFVSRVLDVSVTVLSVLAIGVLLGVLVWVVAIYGLDALAGQHSAPRDLLDGPAPLVS
jgi:hypothetical protein